MATTIDYASDHENPSATIFHGMNECGAEASDYQTTMDENPSATIDYKFCPLLVAAWLSVPFRPESAEAAREGIRCHGPRCAWWDADKERCAVLSLVRNK